MPDLREPGAEAAAAVHACQRASEQALTARDINTLGALLAPELVYVHSTGVRVTTGAHTCGLWKRHVSVRGAQ